MNEWHILTGEFPPDVGGVADYTRAVSLGLAGAGDRVHVWCPGHEREPVIEDPLIVHRTIPDFGSRGLAAADRQLTEFPAPRLLLVQWVPHAFGYRSLNVGFCLWLWKRARIDRDRVEIMVHEASLAFREGSFRKDVAALIHRLMIIILLRAASRVWFSIPQWERRWARYRLGRAVEFRALPVPSNIPRVTDVSGRAAIRARHVGTNGWLVGHFGMQSAHQAELWARIAAALIARNQAVTLLLIGAGSTTLRDIIVQQTPALAGHIRATGKLESSELSQHLEACDVLIQPYPDGINARRGTAMAALAHGRPMVTSIGRHTEPFWQTSGAVELVEPAPEAIAAGTHRLLEDPARREALGETARQLYDTLFDLRHTVSALRDAQRETRGASV